MGGWKKRLKEIQARNPGAVPSWLRGASAGDAWYRVSWQTDAGVELDEAARPALFMLNWLARRGQLTSNGATALRAANSGELTQLAILRSGVEPKGAAFLDQYWEPWWATHGINLSMSAKNAEAARQGVDEFWQLFGTTI